MVGFRAADLDVTARPVAEIRIAEAARQAARPMMTALGRVGRVARWAILLAAAGLAAGFVAALLRPRPKSGYAASDRQPIASKSAERRGAA
jgi:hypothetical protein